MGMLVRCYMSIIYDLNKTMIHFSTVLDEVDFEVNHHQLATAYMAISLGSAYGLNQRLMEKLYITSLFHDIGALFAEERRALIEFDEVDVIPHCQRGADIARSFERLKEYEMILRHHHTSLKEMKEYNRLEPIMSEEEEIIRQMLLFCDQWERMARKQQYNSQDLIEDQGILELGVDLWYSESIYRAFGKLDQKGILRTLGSNELQQAIVHRSPYRDICVGSREVEKLLTSFDTMIDLRFGKKHFSGITPFFKIISRMMKVSEEMETFYLLATYLYDMSIPLYANEANYATLELRRRNPLTIKKAIKMADDCVITADFPSTFDPQHVGYNIMNGCHVFLQAWEELGDKDQGYLWVKNQLEQKYRQGLIDRDIMNLMIDRYTEIDEELYALMKSSHNNMINMS